MVRVLTTDKPTGLHTSTINALLHVIRNHPNGFQISQQDTGEMLLKSKGITLQIDSTYLVDRINDYHGSINDKRRRSAEWFKYI